uniref:Uncharacterized protein n=1 Tax=Tanacetum cinerariifolium TaxID=118510 RepID=A0A6L2KS35_TANCI|nr:hypothetical protein [Tanacetum cinerariifolium]
MEAQTFKETIIQNIDSIEQCIVERARHEQEIQNRLKRLNERKLQILEYKVQKVKAIGASLGDTNYSRIVSNKSNDQGLENQSNTSRDERSMSRNECNDKSTSKDDTNIRPFYDTEPMVEVPCTAEYNVFAVETQHSEQPESISNKCVVKKVDSNVILDSPDMCDNDIQTDQNVEACDDEHPMETKDTLPSCSNSEAQQVQQIQDKAKKSCMVSFRQLLSHLKRLSQNELQGSRTESGFKRAFATLSGQNSETFTRTMFFNVEQLEKQLDKEDFQEIGSMTAFKMQKTKEKVDKSKALDASLVDTESSRTESKEQDTSSSSGNDAHDDDADIRPIYDEEPMVEVQTSAEIEVFAIGQQHTEQPKFNNDGEVVQNAKECHDTCPLPAIFTDNQIPEHSYQSLESKNSCLKKTVAQYQKDFSRLEAHYFKAGSKHCTSSKQDSHITTRVGITIPPSNNNAENSDVHQLSKEISINELKIMMQSYCERMNQQREQEALQAAHGEQELREQEQAAQEKEKPPQNSDFRQLIREVCGTKVCEAQKQNMGDTMLELLEEVKNIVEQAPKCRTRIIESLQNFRVVLKMSYISNTSQMSPVNAITPVLPTEEPEYSLSMRDEHLSTISKTESDEVIKSSVENLVPILSESEGILDHICDVPFSDKNHFDAEYDLIESLLTRDTLIVYSPKIDSLLEEFTGELAHIDSIPPGIDETDFDPKDDIRFIEQLLYNDTSSEDDSFEFDYVEALPPDSEPVSLEEVQGDILREKLLNIHLLIDKIDDHIEETSSGSTTTHADNSHPEYDSFLFETDLIRDLDFSSSDDSLGSGLDVSFPSKTRNKIFDPRIFIEVQSERLLSWEEFSISFIRDPLYPVFKPGILSYLLISHRDKITSDFSKNPMMMYGGDIPHLDVPFLHFYPP